MKIEDRTRQSIKPRDKQDIALAHEFDTALQFITVSRRTGLFFGKDLFASGLR